ncbi:MAG: S8 family serine peptidase [Flavobacteriaceae bacterium]
MNCKQKKGEPQEDLSLREETAWIHLDPEIDSVAGISLDRAYDELISENEGQEVIVAVIDEQVNLRHEDLMGQIYTNPKEIPNNNIDDDNNNYVDDVHGWNFLGYDKYKYERFLSYPYIRVIRELEGKYKDKAESDIDPSNLEEYNRYREAVQRQKLKAEDELYIEPTLRIKAEYYSFIKTFSDRIPGHENYTIAQLDTLEIRNEEEKKLVQAMKQNVNYGYTFDYTYKDEENILIEVFTLNNINYNERANIGDDPFDYETQGYGNGNVQAPDHLSHGTQVSGMIAATRNNGVGIRGISNKIKIMPLVVSPEYGEESDKDLAMAIRYAVDNGAKIINMSNGKEYTENSELLFSALKYAENNGVLFVTSAGNSGKDIDRPENVMYLTDTFGQTDSVSNLIRVGATTRNLDSTLFDPRLNFGKENVDLFAPGVDITTTDTSIFRYKETSGSSLSAAMTSGVAALLLSKYPNLTHVQLKHILMESGTSFDYIVKTREKDSVPFKELSKSGKVLNAYNALKMAASIGTQ